MQDFHDLELGLGHGPLLDTAEDRLELRQARLRRRVALIGLPGRLADQVADRAPNRRLRDEVDVGVGIGLPALAFQDPAWLAAAGIVAGPRHRISERNAFAILAVFGERSCFQALLVAQFHAREVEHAVLHGGEHLLAAAGAVALEQGRDDAERQMQAGAAVADLCAGDERRPVAEAGGRGRAAGALRDVLVDLAVLIRSGAEALDRGDDHARIELVDVLPGQAHAIERARREILHQHVADLDQFVEHPLAFRMLGIDRDRALVVVEHREIERVRALHVDQLTARDVAHARTLDLDHVGTEPGQQLRAGRTGLHMREIENAHPVERLAGLAEGLFGRRRQQRFRGRLLRGRLALAVILLRLRAGLFHGRLQLGFDFRLRFHRGDLFEFRSLYFFFCSTLCGLRLPMRPLSEPAAGSSTALISVGLPQSIASFTARLSSSGVVAFTPIPPKASIILS